jgi:hypothetical protein
MNTKQPTSERVSQIAIVLPCAVGSAVILRALAVYLPHDPVACMIVGIMGVGFVAGFAELWLRSRRAYALGREVDALPRKATEAILEKASGPLKAFLRARVEHAPTPPGNENLTPYLVGFMVMLGLLGTLLGLFETLHGAGQALTASADVDALRRGLSAPMRGLTRSFGCSAAGVSASAMLGLASVFVRRAEAAAWTRAQSYATGPLRELSPMRRQLDSFQQLARQGEALPRAALALEQASVQLGQLAERWETAHRKSQEEQQKSAQELLSRMRDELARTAADAGRAVSEGVNPILKQVVGQTGDALTRQVNATREALDKDFALRRDADKALRDSLREEITGTRKEAQEHLAALAGAANAVARQLEQDGRSRHEAADRLLSELGQRLDASEAQRADASRQELASLASLGEQLVSNSETRERALNERWETLVDHIQSDLSGLASQVERNLSARTEQDRQVGQTMERSLAALEQGAAGLNTLLGQQERAVTELLGQQDRAVQELVSQSAAQLREVVASNQNGARESLAQLVKLGEEHTARFAQLENDALGQLLKLGEEHTARFTQLENDALGQLFKLSDDQTTRFAKLESEGLAQVLKLSEEHAARFVQLEALLQQTQTSHAQTLAGDLSAHAERLSKGLETTTQLVHEAATVLGASSAEMGAVATLFHQSVDRQREAAQAWMETLGEIEGAVERAGRGAAADALGDQLASTQEVFARQLQFQRELFEQLRTLRSAGSVGTPNVAKGERDVSA